MGEKQLDFNAPLLSVRRFTAASSRGDEGGGKRSDLVVAAAVKELSPLAYRSDLTSGPVRNPGAVPFVWELVPGKPKDEPVVGPVPSANSDGKLLEWRSPAPRPPPGRVVDGGKGRGKTVGDEDREIAKVGRLQNDHAVELASSASTMVNPRDVLAQNLGGKAYGGSCLKEKEREKGRKNLEEEDDCDAYSDASQTLSVAELSLFNGSISDLSSSDGQELKRADNSDEMQVRSFMMERFLPAAKAMASETPQYAPRKQPIASEPVRQVSRFRRDGESPPSQPKPCLLHQLVLEAEEEDDDDVENDEDPGNSIAKSCGFIPWSLRNSWCLTNPLMHAPRERSKTQTPLDFASGKGAKSNNSGSFSGSDELTWEVVYGHKLMRNVLALGVYDGGSKVSESASSPSVYEDAANNQFSYWSDSQGQDESSSYRHSTGGISPYRNESTSSPFREGSGFLGVPKSGKSCSSEGSELNMRGLETRTDTSHCRSKGTSGSMSPAIEKTVYVDSVSANTKSSQLEIRDLNRLMDEEPSTWVEECLEQGKLFSESNTVTNYVEVDKADEREIRNFDPAKPVKAHPGLPFTGWPPCAYTSHHNGNECDAPIHGNDTIINKSRSLMPLVEQVNGVVTGLDTDFSREQVTGNMNSSEADIEGKSSLSHSLLPPPLPKSPSESWLFRALPTVSTQNASTLLFFQNRSNKNVTKAPADPKWEAIIKSTNVCHGHLRYSEELGQTMPHQTEN